MHVRIRRVLATTAAGVLLAAGSVGTAYADVVINAIDSTVDLEAEQMSLVSGGADGTTTIYVSPANGDGEPGCNLKNDGQISVSPTSSNPSVATVSMTDGLISDCGVESGKSLTVRPVGVGTTIITLTGTPGTGTIGAFNLAPATFTVTVSAPVVINTPPVVGVTGFTNGDTFELGVDQLPTPGCSVQDAEDSGESATPGVVEELDAYGLGTTTVTCEYTDTGGETASASASYTTVDTLDPVITRVAVTPPANEAGWNNTAVTATWTCSDLGTGVRSGTVSDTTVVEGSALSLTGTCSDRAGHSTSDTVSGIKVDLTAPDITIGRTPAIANEHGWNNGDVTVAWTCADGLSGAIDEGGSEVLGEGQGQSASGTCTDLAGNTSSNEVTGVNVDKTAPTLSWTDQITDGSSFFFGAVPAAPGCTASDTLSDLVAGCTVTGHSSSVGQHTVTATAQDKAGNETSLSSTYEVKAWTVNGYSRPVDMGTVLNTVKNGSTVPLKFEVFVGPTELTSTAAIDAEFQVKGIVCPGQSTPTDDIELTTTGGTSFRYDTTGGQFIQNWQTPKKPGACYTVSTTTADGTSITANFLLK